MKKTFSLLAALMLIVMLLPVTAMAYDAVTPGENGAPTLNAEHTLKITDHDLNTLPDYITYKFELSDFEVVAPTDIINDGEAITNTDVVTINSITYSPTDVIDSTTKSISKGLTVNWSSEDKKLQIKEPGIYRWTVTKTVETDLPDADMISTTSYLYVYAQDNGGVLKIATVFMAKNEDMTEKTIPEDHYPIKTVDLSIGKEVTGNQGSKDQYFNFNIQLEFPAAVTATYTITGNPTYDLTIPTTAYNVGGSNPGNIVVKNGSTANVSLWLKNGQGVKITGLLYGTNYTITETVTGYTTTYKCTEGTTETSGDGVTVTDASMVDNTTVEFTNNKSSSVPTGITLNTAAPVMGILLAMSLLAVMYLGKRKEYQA